MALNKTKLTLALGSAIAASLSVSPASASESPFASQALSRGYMVAAADSKSESKATEAKSGVNKKKHSRDCDTMKKNLKEDKSMDAKCGAKMSKEMEGKCGAEGKCGGAMMKKDAPAPAKASEGKCAAEGRCGNMMKPEEKKVEDKPKAPEGKCAAGKCGAMMK